MAELKVKMELTLEQEKRLIELKKLFNEKNNAKMFKKLLEVKILIL